MSIQKCILILDDDQDIRELIQMILVHKGGYSVILTDTPESMEKELSSNQVDLIFLDMLLSGANGLDVCEGLKQSETNAKIPVIMLSAHPKAKELAMNAGADDFISKPFDLQDFFNTIDRHLL